MFSKPSARPVSLPIFHSWFKEIGDFNHLSTSSIYPHIHLSISIYPYPFIHIIYLSTSSIYPHHPIIHASVYPYHPFIHIIRLSISMVQKWKIFHYHIRSVPNKSYWSTRTFTTELLLCKETMFIYFIFKNRFPHLYF